MKKASLVVMGGDEFLIFLKERTLIEAEEIIKRFVEDKQRFSLKDKECVFTISAGLVEWPTQGRELKEICRKADAALYSVKIHDKHGYRFYNEELKDQNRSQLGFNITDIASGIPGAILVYQAYEDERILFANNDLVELFECDDLTDFMEFTGSTFKNIVHPFDRARVQEQIWTQIKKQRSEGIKESEAYNDYVDYRIVTKSGKVKTVEDYGRLVHSVYYGDIFYVFIHDKYKKEKHMNTI